MDPLVGKVYAAASPQCELEARLKNANIENVLQYALDNLHPPVQSDYVVEIFDGGLRSITVDGIQTWQIKRRLFVQNYEHNVNLVVSKEIPAAAPSVLLQPESTEHREISRQSFLDLAQKFRLDVSRVNNDWFEVEIEFFEFDQELIQETINRVCTAAYGELFNISLWLQSIFGNTFPGKRPIDAVPEHDLSEYTITPKHNGVREALVINFGKCFSVTPSGNVTFICEFPEYNTLVLDSEVLVDNSRIILDVIYGCDGNFEDRRELMKLVVDKLPGSSLVSTMSSLEATSFLENMNDDEFDGVVFIPDDLSKQALKFKPDRLMTVDVIIMKTQDDVFDLFTHKGSLFKANVKSEKPVPSDWLNVVVEIKFLSASEFSCIRLRPDRTAPNSTFVANKIFDRISKPVVFSDLQLSI